MHKNILDSFVSLAKSETYEDESKKINENKKSPEAKKRHKFKKAKWTFPNGHPRCSVCGDEERIGGYCEGRLEKSENSEQNNTVSFSTGLGKHRQLRHFLSHEPEQKASKQKLKENGFDVQQMGYNQNLDSKGFLHHDHVHNKIENEPKMSFEFGLGKFNHENVPNEAKQYYHLKNFKPEKYGVSPDDEEGVNNAIAQHMEDFDPEKDYSQRHSDETSQVFHLNATPEHIQRMKDEGVHQTFQNMMDVERRSGHPNLGNTVGWVRFTNEHHEDPEKSGYHMDEIQNDLSHSWIDQTVSQIEEGLRTKQITPLQAQRIHDNAKNSFPDEHLKKINDILFEGKHPNDVLHEAFLQHLRDKGEAGKQVHLWQAAPKAKMSDMDTEKSLPAHMLQTYHKSPSKMGYKPSVYGELATQNGEHFGEPTWKHTLVKKEDYQSNARKGLMISFPATVNGNKYRPDMNGVHYHSTIRQFDPEDNSAESVHKQASMVDLTPPSEETKISFGHLTGRDGSKHHVIFLHGDYENKAKEYRNKIKESNPKEETFEYRPHISVDQETWNELKFKNPKTIKEAGISFGHAEIHQGHEKKYSFKRIDGELHKSEFHKKHPFNPKEIDIESHREPVRQWVSGDREAKEDIPRLEGNARARGLHKVSGWTKTRLAPNGEREFLLHRGVGNTEHMKFADENSINFDKQKELKSWTPDWLQAYNFSGDPNGTQVLSAWIPESEVHHVPMAIGTQEGPNTPYMKREQEVMVNHSKPLERLDLNEAFQLAMPYLKNPKNVNTTRKVMADDGYKEEKDLSNIHHRINLKKGEFEALEKAYVKARPDHPFKVGDRVKKLGHLDSHSGKVTEIKSDKKSDGTYGHVIKVQRDDYTPDKKLGHGGRGDAWDHASYYEKETSDLNKSESLDKQTMLNKLSQTTEKRKLPCGQIGFLMHRGMDSKEYQDNHNGGQAKYKKQILEWTPDYQKAKNNAEKIVSAWIPEKSVLKSNGDSYLVDSEGPFYHAHTGIVKNNMFLKD